MKRPADYLGTAKSLTQKGAAVCSDIGRPKAAAPENPEGTVLARIGEALYELPNRYYSPLAVLRGRQPRLNPERFIDDPEDYEEFDLLLDSIPDINDLTIPENMILDYTYWVIKNWGNFENPDGTSVLPSLSRAKSRGLTLRAFLEPFKIRGGQGE